MATVTTPAEVQLMTGEEFALTDVPDWHELVRGRIVAMPPPNFAHGRVEMNIAYPVMSFLEAHSLGEFFGGETGIYTGRNPDTVRGVDLAFITHERLARRDKSKNYLDVAPDWITEILSPSNTKAYVEEKLEEYFNIGVRLVWLADPENRCVHVYRSMTNIRTLQETDTITGEDVLPGFSASVAKFFKNL